MTSDLRTSRPDDMVSFQKINDGLGIGHGQTSLVVMLAAILNNLYRGFVFAEVSASFFTIARGKETFSCYGRPAEIMLLELLGKQCDAYWPFKHICRQDGVKAPLERLIADAGKVIVTLDAKHAAPFDLPQHELPLAKVLMLLATGVNKPDDIARHLHDRPETWYKQTVEFSLRDGISGVTAAQIAHFGK